MAKQCTTVNVDKLFHAIAQSSGLFNTMQIFYFVKSAHHFKIDGFRERTVWVFVT